MELRSWKYLYKGGPCELKPPPTMSTFKLTKRDGLTRRITFPSLPNWNELAGRISSLYSVPLETVAVSYIDADDDEVTLSTEDELQDYYRAAHKPGQAMKFVVQDLSASRVEDKALPQTPRTANRNTFGGGLPFDIDSDWNIPNMAEIFSVPNVGMDSPHAFVEVVPTDASSIRSKSSHTDDDNSSTTSDTHSTIQSLHGIPRQDKGKGKAVEPFSSTASLLGDKMASKHDLHVYDVNTNNVQAPLVDVPAPSSNPTSLRSVPSNAPIGTESTPKAAVRNIDDSAKAAAAPAADDQAPDPPLPSIDATPEQERAKQERANASLANDVAVLLSTLSGVFAAHPELSEGLRNIVNNASNGSYWNRDAVHSATESVIQAAHTVEEEAGRRVAEALGSILRTVSGIVDPTSGAATPAEPARSGNDRPTVDGHPISTSFWYGPNRHPSGLYNGFAPPAFPPFNRGPPGGPAGRSWGNWLPPFPRDHRGHAGPLHRPQHGVFPGGPFNGPHHGPPPPGPPPPPPPPGAPRSPPAPSNEPGGSDHHSPMVPPPPFPPGGFGNNHGWSSLWGPHSGAPPPPPEPFRQRNTPADLRAQVDAAKLLYKAEKERYRQEREQRKREKEMRLQQMIAAEM